MFPTKGAREGVEEGVDISESLEMKFRIGSGGICLTSKVLEHPRKNAYM